MSGPPPNKIPRGGFGRESQSPIHYRPPSPWTAPSPPPIISGPPGPRPTLNSPGIRSPYSPIPGAVNRSNQNSPSFGANGLRGTRGTGLPCPRPQWPNPQQQPPTPSASFNPSNSGFHQEIPYTPPLYQAPQPYQPRSVPTPTPPPPSTSSSSVKTNKSPAPYIPTGSHISPLDYMRRPSVEYPQYEYAAPPPPGPKSYVIYDDEDEGGLSTAEIIANQSQDYVDEKLAEYQATIFQLQGRSTLHLYHFLINLLETKIYQQYLQSKYNV